jgi:transposase
MISGRRLSHISLSHSGLLAEPINGGLAVAATRCRRAKFFPPLFMFCAPAVSGRLYPRNLAVPVRCINISKTGKRPAFLPTCGGPDWRNTINWKALPGNGKVLMGRSAKPRSPKNVSAPTRRIGEKNGRKRSVLTDGRGVPLAIAVSGANVHDVKLLEPTLAGIMVPPPAPTQSPTKNLCADAGYKGKTALEIIVSQHYIPHVKQRREEAVAKQNQPGFKARRWVVERTHSWTNRFRKLLVSFEKTEASYLALLSLAAAMICWRQIIFIYG